MKIIVAGGRDFNNPIALNNILLDIINPKEDIIVCGDARGADLLGAEWAAQHAVPIQHFPAYWDTYGKAAGYIRNAEMAEYGDMLIAFWDGKSKGTMNMIKAMKLHKKPYYVYSYQGELINNG